MTRTSLANVNCSFARAADRIGDRWTLLIIRDAFFGVRSFVEFKRRLGVAPTVLTDRLDRLCADGILERFQRRDGVDRHLYRLSVAGRALFPIVVGLMQWGDTHISGEGNEPVRLLDRATGQPLAPLRATSCLGEPISAAGVTFVAGPGADDATRAEFERRASPR